MESAPPSYETATLSDVLTVIAPYILTSDLYAATLVSKRFFNAINPRLWGNPALYIGLEHDGINDFLARFQKTLAIARLSVRSLVHTLHIPSSSALYFDDRPADWLVKLLQLLPSLQSLVVEGLRNFDHAALQGLSVPGYQNARPQSGAQPNAKDVRQDIRSTTGPSSTLAPTLAMSLKLLNASQCGNLTVSSLARALPAFTSLICLDLSYCTAARHPSMLSALGALWHLKILRLRKIGLDDDGCLALADAVSRRVASLDVRDNLLTDKSIELLIRSCIGDTPNYDYTSQLAALRPLDLAIYRSAGMEDSIIRSLTRSFVNRLAIEDLNEQGITHLYLAGNQLSMHSVQLLLQQRVVNVLDIGDITASWLNSFDVSMNSVNNTLVQLRMPHYGIAVLSANDNESAQLPLFRPSLYPRLRTLTLTTFPQCSSTDNEVASIITLIEECALEEQRAKKKAMQDYTIPPGRQGLPSALRSSAQGVFALQTIVLEVICEQQQQHQNQNIIGDRVRRQDRNNKSFTDDADSASLWQAAETDFSFFPEERTLTTSDARQRHDSLVRQQQNSTVDNLALLSTFRKQRKLARETDVRAKGIDSVTPGYWEGVIEILRQ